MARAIESNTWTVKIGFPILSSPGFILLLLLFYRAICDVFCQSGIRNKRRESRESIWSVQHDRNEERGKWRRNGMGFRIVWMMGSKKWKQNGKSWDLIEFFHFLLFLLPADTITKNGLVCCQPNPAPILPWTVAIRSLMFFSTLLLSSFTITVLEQENSAGKRVLGE